MGTKFRERKEGEIIPRPGTRVEYKGKKYISLRELSRDIDVPYLPLLHKYEGIKILQEMLAHLPVYLHRLSKSRGESVDGRHDPSVEN